MAKTSSKSPKKDKPVDSSVQQENPDTPPGTPPVTPTPTPTPNRTDYQHKDGSWISVKMSVAAEGLKPWLQVTSKKTGYKVFIPLPIRLIEQIPDLEGSGCIVHGAYGDKVATTDNVVEILDRLSGFPLKSASVWSLAE